jgi:hypothetical protein
MNLAVLNTLDALTDVFAKPLGTNLAQALEIARHRILAHAVRRQLSEEVAMRTYYRERLIGQVLSLVYAIGMFALMFKLTSTHELISCIVALGLYGLPLALRFGYLDRLRKAGTLP